MAAVDKFDSTIVTVSYEDLIRPNADLSGEIERAYGPSGLGILIVAGIPGYVEHRSTLLPLAHRVAHLSDEAKGRLEDPLATYSIGWCHGKESFDGGKPDILKGSFYGNPLRDVTTTDQEEREKYPVYARPNRWPGKDLPELEPAFKQLGQTIYPVGLLVTQHCDQYVSSRNPTAPPHKLTRVLARSQCHKGRLLRYYPDSRGREEVEEGGALDSWGGWHFDHGSLTGLTCAMYMDEEGREVGNPDPSSGLYIEDRLGRVVKAVFPPSSLAFQIGRSMQIHSGGLLRATRHCVKRWHERKAGGNGQGGLRGVVRVGGVGPQAANGAAGEGIGRNTFALFLQPHWDEPMDLPPTPRMSAEPVGVAKWMEEGMSFGEFAEKSIRENYVS